MVSLCGVPNSVSGPAVPFTLAATATDATPRTAIAASATTNLDFFI